MFRWFKKTTPIPVKHHDRLTIRFDTPWSPYAGMISECLSEKDAANLSVTSTFFNKYPSLQLLKIQGKQEYLLNQILKNENELKQSLFETIQRLPNDCVRQKLFSLCNKPIAMQNEVRAQIRTDACYIAAPYLCVSSMAAYGVTLGFVKMIPCAPVVIPCVSVTCVASFSSTLNGLFAGYHSHRQDVWNPSCVTMMFDHLFLHGCRLQHAYKEISMLVQLYPETKHRAAVEKEFYRCLLK